MTLSAPASAGEIVTALGGKADPTPMGEVKGAMLRSNIDGTVRPLEVLKTWDTAAAVKYVTVDRLSGAGYPFYLVMNKRAYDRLEDIPEVKGTFDRLVAEYKQRFAEMESAIDLAGEQYGREKGVEFISLSPDEALRWTKAVGPVIDKYVKDMVGKGHPEAEVRVWLQFIRERIAYWTARQTEPHAMSTTTPTRISADESLNGKTVRMASGGLLQIGLDSNPTTGFRWELTRISDTAVIEKVSNAFDTPTFTLKEGAPPPAGTGGMEFWNFKALNKGTATISMEYSRPWEGGEKGVRKFSLTVIVE